MKPNLFFYSLCIISLVSQLFLNITPASALENNFQIDTTGTALNKNKGLAMATHHPEDLLALRVSWWYVWGWCDQPNCIPMVYAMELPPSCPPILLVGNEPNARAPNGSPVTPAVAATKVRAIEQKCPRTQLVVGNVAYDDWSSVGGWGSGYNWLTEFLSEYQKQSGKPFAQTLGVHCYSTQLSNYCIMGLNQMRQLYKGEMWVTEFGLLNGNAAEYAFLIEYIDMTFTRYAAYTNRQPHTGEGWEISTGVELVNDDGTLKPAGVVYARK